MPHPTRLALIDCNNFFVSCEQVFNPQLRDRPVVVLSNNDGCVVARSAEAKQMGIPMGAPYFQVRQKLAAIHGVALSSNYALYADMSRRVMQLIREQIPGQEVYSIDECFVDFSGFSADQALIEAFKIRQRLRQCLGLRVSVGLGASKTQAKLASEIAKQRDTTGVCDLSGRLSDERAAEMAAQPTSQIWGIGRRTAASLESDGVCTVGDLLAKPDSWIRKRYSITLLRTINELKGQPCLDFQVEAVPRQQVIASRSFGQPVYKHADLVEAVSTFVSRAAERLRADRSLTAMIQVYYRAKDPASQGEACSDSAALPLPVATDDTRVLIRHALQALDRIYRPGLKYKKAGVVLTNISPAQIRQPELFGLYAQASGPSAAMCLMDQVNQRYGRDTVRIASMGVSDDAAWHMSCSRRTRRYTTSLDELPVFTASGMT